MRHARTGEEWLGSWQKRAFDVAFASSLLPAALPLAAASVTLIMAIEREPPLIIQHRVGQSGRTIDIAKLRTMPHGTVENMSNGHYDERRTRIGRILSATRVDEAPQLWNVLGGSMSAVGLRPLVKSHHDEFMASLRPALRARVAHAYDVAPAGWFDPYGIDLYIHGIEDTHEARAESILKYTFEEASAARDVQIIFQALGIVKSLVADTGIDILPDHNPPPIQQFDAGQ